MCRSQLSFICVVRTFGREECAGVVYNALLIILVVENVLLSLSIEWNSIRLGGLAHGIVTKTTQNSVRGWGDWKWGLISVKSLKIDIAERTRSSESLLLKMTYINIFAENHKKNKEILSENVSRQIMTSLGHMTSFDRPSCQDVGCFIHNM